MKCILLKRLNCNNPNFDRDDTTNCLTCIIKIRNQEIFKLQDKVSRRNAMIKRKDVEIEETILALSRFADVSKTEAKQIVLNYRNR